MTSWPVTLGCVLLPLGAAACSSDGNASAPTTTLARTTVTTASTVPERPTSPTTTIYDPATVEGQVEAAYLKSWDVYADAVYNLELDEAALTEVYADPLLTVRRNEIADRVNQRRASLVRVDHNYRIDMTGRDTAAVVDTYRNHQVLIDETSRQPIEQDPDATIIDAFTLRLVGGTWTVFDQRRLK